MVCCTRKPLEEKQISERGLVFFLSVVRFGNKLITDGKGLGKKFRRKVILTAETKNEAQKN
jgi:hypothetical protein